MNQFQFLNVNHDDRAYNQHFLQLCEFYDIKKKLFEIVTNNVNNNEIIKKEFEKNLNNWTWDRSQNAISCLIYITNLMI